MRMILDSELNLTLRPMKYPIFYEMFKSRISNTWAVDEMDFSDDLTDLNKMTASEKHSIFRLVAFLATGNSIISNNLVLNLYKHINSSEARLYLSRQLYEKALHAQFYLTLFDTYILHPEERAQIFLEVNNIPSIKNKSDFCVKWMNSIHDLSVIKTTEDRRKFLMNMICFATCIEGMFFSAASAYVYFLKSKGFLKGLTLGANQVFSDETMHMVFAMNVIETVKKEDPNVFNEQMEEMIIQMLEDAIDCEMTFAEDLVPEAITELSLNDIRQYLEYIADQHLESLDIPARYNAKNPFEKRTSDYQAEA